MAYFLSIDGLSMKRIMAICVGFLAIIILIAPGFEGQTDPFHYGYLGMALLALFLHALSFIIMSFSSGSVISSAFHPVDIWRFCAGTCSHCC